MIKRSYYSKKTRINNTSCLFIERTGRYGQAVHSSNIDLKHNEQFAISFYYYMTDSDAVGTIISKLTGTLGWSINTYNTGTGITLELNDGLLDFKSWPGVVKKDSWNCITVYFNGTVGSNNTYLFVNGRQISDIGSLAPTALSNSGADLILGRHTITDNTSINMGIQHIVIMKHATDLSLLKVKVFHENFHKYAGFVHKDTHLYAYAHYPCSEHTAYNTGSYNVLFDVAKQYDYIKSSVLSANHMRLIGYTNDEVGTGNPSKQRYLKHFYDKDDTVKIGFKYDSNTGYWTIPDNAAYVWNSNDLIVMEGWVTAWNKSTVSPQGALFSSNYVNLANPYIWFLELYSSGTSITFRVAASTGNDIVMISNSSILLGLTKKIGRLLYVKFTMNGNLAANCRIYFNNINVTSLFTVTNDNLPASTDISPTGLMSIGRRANTTNDSLRNQIVHRFKMTVNGVVQLDIRMNADESNTPTEIITGNALSPVGLTGKSNSRAYWLDERTYTRTDKALYFNGNRYLRVPNFNETNEMGYTYVIGWKHDFNNPTNFEDLNLLFKRTGTGTPNKQVGWVGGSNAFTSIGVGGNAGTYASTTAKYPSGSSLFTQLNFTILHEKIGTSNVLGSGYINGFDKNSTINAGISNFNGWNVSTDDLYIGTDPFDAANRALHGHMFYLAIYKGILTHKEILEDVNCYLGGYPVMVNRPGKELKLLPDFGSGFDDSGTLRLRDLSGNYLINATAWPDLATLQSNTVNLNSLR